MELPCKALGCDLARVNQNFCKSHTKKLYPVYRRYKRLENQAENDAFGIYSRVALLREYYHNNLKLEYRDEGHKLAIRQRKELVEKLAAERVVSPEVEEDVDEDVDEDEAVDENESVDESEVKVPYDSQLEERVGCVNKFREAMAKRSKPIEDLITRIFRSRLSEDYWLLETVYKDVSNLYTASLVWAYSGLRTCKKDGQSSIPGPEGMLGIDTCCIKKAAEQLLRNRDWYQMVFEIASILAAYHISGWGGSMKAIRLNCKRQNDKIIANIVTPRMKQNTVWSLDADVVCDFSETEMCCAMCFEELRLELPYKSLGRHCVDMTYDVSRNSWI